MEQTKFLLVSARKDYSQALNVLFLVQAHMIPTSIEDIMHAYMVAKEWCEQIKSPTPSPERHLTANKEDYMPLLDMFESYADKLGRELKEEQSDVEAVFLTLNPNLVHLWRTENQATKYGFTVFFRMLRYTARLFEEEFGDGYFNEILEQNEMPPLSELGEV